MLARDDDIVRAHGERVLALPFAPRQGHHLEAERLRVLDREVTEAADAEHPPRARRRVGERCGTRSRRCSPRRRAAPRPGIELPPGRGCTPRPRRAVELGVAAAEVRPAWARRTRAAAPARRGSAPRPFCIHETPTRSPTRSAVTSAPTSTIVLTGSCPRTNGGCTMGSLPPWTCKSAPHVPRPRRG